MNDEQNRFSHEVKLFFQSYLPNIKGLSPNTMLSYRDTLKFYFHFLSSAGHPIDKLDFCDFSRENVLQFLDFLEQKEKNSISTNNIEKRKGQIIADIKTNGGFLRETMYYMKSMK